MNKRKVKKWSKMARKNPGKLKPFQWVYLMKSWSRSFRQTDAITQDAILKTMARAYGQIIGAWLQAMKPRPRKSAIFPPGGVLVGEHGPEIIVNERGNYQLMNNNTPMRKGEKFVVNGEEFTAQ